MNWKEMMMMIVDSCSYQGYCFRYDRFDQRREDLGACL